MLYLYLQKRNKNEIKIISTISTSAEITARKIDDISKIGFKSKDVSGINEIIEKYKLDWEVWAESANNYTQLKTNLKKSGIMAPSSPNTPLHHIALEENLSETTISKLRKSNSMVRRMC